MLIVIRSLETWQAHQQIESFSQSKPMICDKACGVEDPAVNMGNKAISVATFTYTAHGNTRFIDASIFECLNMITDEDGWNRLLAEESKSRRKKQILQKTRK